MVAAITPHREGACAQATPSPVLQKCNDKSKIGLLFFEYATIILVGKSGSHPRHQTKEIHAMNTLYSLLGRFGLSAIFILSGFGKIAGYAGTQQYMASAGVPGGLLPLVILLEVGGGLAILAGAGVRWVAPLLALFTIASAALFHSHLADQMQFINFMKNIAIAGGFLLLAAQGAGGWSVDAWRAKRVGNALASAQGAA